MLSHEDSSSLSRCETHQDESCLGATFRLREVQSWGIWHTVGCRGREFGDCIGYIMACFGDEPKMEKVSDLSDLRRNMYGKIGVLKRLKKASHF